MSDNKEGRREVTMEEAMDLYKSGQVSVGQVKIEAVITIFDKDGNIKSTFEASTDALNEHLTEEQSNET